MLFAVGFAAALGVMALRDEHGDKEVGVVGPASIVAADQSAGQAAARAAGHAAAKKAELVAIRDEALSSVKAQLLDQFSSQFQGLYYMPGAKLNDKPVTVVCGQVNAKNRFGGYVGWKDFIYIDGESHLDGPEGEVSTILARVYLKVCMTAEKNRQYLPTD